MSLGGKVPRQRGGEVVSPVPRWGEDVKKQEKCSPGSSSERGDGKEARAAKSAPF